MPRTSRRLIFIEDLKTIFKKRMIARAIRKMFEDDEEEGLGDFDVASDCIDVVVALTLAKALQRRYLFRTSKNRKGKSEPIFQVDLKLQESRSDKEECSSASSEDTFLPWLNDIEFLQKYRMSRESFDRVVDYIKDHPVFQSKTKQQAPVAHQLMTWLKYAGTEGSGSSNANQQNTFKIGYGTADVFRSRVTIALQSLSNTYYFWPDATERLKIGKEILKEYGFPHCVGVADGTLFPLAFEPETKDAPDYSGRKYGYSLSTMIICDNKRRIRHYLAGFPGSAHDNRIFKATKLVKDANTYFSEREYIIGDSAFENSSHMVSAFKKPKGEEIPRNHEQFNEKLARLRILSEHTIGILKGRFPWLRSIRFKINESKESIRRILQMLKATVVLHNMLIEFGEEERNEWLEEDDCSEIDDAERAPYEDGDALNVAIPDGAPKDERRKRLMYYFEEHFYFV